MRRTDVQPARTSDDRETYRMDTGIEAQRNLFTPDELRRLRGYRERIDAVTYDEVYTHNEKPTGRRKMNKTFSEVLGDDFNDYIGLVARFQL